MSKQAAEAAADKANSELGDMRDFLGGVAETFARRYSALFCAAALCLEKKLRTGNNGFGSFFVF